MCSYILPNINMVKASVQAQQRRRDIALLILNHSARSGFVANAMA
jgi:hypothetical protein